MSFAQEVEVGTSDYEQISPTPLYQEGQESSENEDEFTSLIKEGDHEVVEDLQPQEDETPMDSYVAIAPQNDNLMSSWTEGEGSYVQIDNFNAQDSSLRSEWQIWSQVDSSADASEWQEDDKEDEEELESELIISEVYYDGKDEWIEVFNIWNGDFVWDIELSWAIYYSNRTSQTYSNIQIPANNFVIIANSDAMFGFSGDVNIILNEWNYKKFSIADTKEIQISLVLSWEEVDWFYAHEYRVKKRDNREVSLHKILTYNGAIVTRAYSNDKANLAESVDEDSEWFANPWVLYTSADEIVDYWKDPNAEPEEEFEPLDCSDVYDDAITISEVFRWWSRYKPYVEFSIHEDIDEEYTHLILSWSLLAQQIIIDLDEESETYDREDLQKNTKLILTTDWWNLTEAGLITIILHPELSFNSFSWELELYGIVGQSRQVLDIVKITDWMTEKSTYHSGSNHYCWSTMDTVMDFSPWFDESALKYFSVTSKYNEKIVETVKYVWWWGGCSCPTKEQLCGKEKENVIGTWNTASSWTEWNESEGSYVWNEWDTQDSSASASEWQAWWEEPHPTPLLLGEGTWNVVQWQAVKIVSLEEKNPESITLQSFLPYDIDFSNHDYYLKTSTATTKKYIDGILHSNTIDTFTKSFWFVDAWACVYLYSWDLQLDSLCYSTEKTEKEKSDQKEESFNPSDYQISITDIDYDPDWSDSGNETITIKSNSSKALDLSKIKMKVNTTNKKLTWILEPYSSITLKWSFGFPNSTKDDSDVVVILFYDDYIFSTYTYNPNKPKIEIPDGAVKVYSVIDGDTFRYRKEDWSLQSVRLLGVDAPESNTARYRSTECFWKEAKNHLTNLIKNQYVTLEYDSNSASSDAYGRMLAYVYLDWKLVNEELITEWYAKEYTYKTAYSHQSDFKLAEEKARKSEKWLRSSSTCWKSIEEEPEAWGVDYEKLLIKISNVIYDPDGTDSWNESVQLSVNNSQISGVSSIDFSDEFSLTIFPRSEYATWSTKTKKLSEFWIFDLSISPEITLKWNFWLPNSRATCVSLNQWSYTFDTRCYNPDGLLSEDETDILTWDLATIPDVKIKSIIPNPSGKDSEKEEITLLWSVNEDIQNSPESQTTLDLSPDFSLLINWKTKKKLAGNLIPNQNITIKWSFWLPNSASCVSLLYKWEELDEFCYGKASDGVKFNSNNTAVSEISEEELAIVKSITLVKQWDSLCVSYNKTLFGCKSIPNSTTEKDKKMLSMQNSYITELQNYIKSNYSMIYYDSKIKDYFDLYSESKKAIKAWDEAINLNTLTDVSASSSNEYQQDAKSLILEESQIILPEFLKSALLQIRDMYSKLQVEKSDLSFLDLGD